MHKEIRMSQQIPLYALYENLAGGATVAEFVEWFPASMKRKCEVCSNTRRRGCAWR